MRRGHKHVIGVVIGARSGRTRNAYMVSMLTKALKRAPNRSNQAIANLAGKPPGLKPKPKVQLPANAPLPKPKPETEAEAVVAAVVPEPEPQVAPASLVVPSKPTVLIPQTTQSATPTAPGERDTWSIQIGAFSDEHEAKRRLSATLGLGLAALDGKEPFTVAFYKKDKLLYRARISGFNQKDARSTCRVLKRKSISCFPLGPEG